jgi:hypothetical protein
VADFYGLRFEEVPGSTSLLEKLVRGEWDDAFVVAEPGEQIRMEAFLR